MRFLEEQANIAKNLGLSEPVPGDKFLEREIAEYKLKNKLPAMGELIDAQMDKKYQVRKNNLIKSQIEKEFDLLFKYNSNFSAAV